MNFAQIFSHRAIKASEGDYTYEILANTIKALIIIGVTMPGYQLSTCEAIFFMDEYHCLGKVIILIQSLKPKLDTRGPMETGVLT